MINVLINPYNSVHHAFRQSVSNANAEQNGRSGEQEPNQTDAPTASNPAVIVSFSRKVPITNLETYYPYPTDENAEMLEILAASVRAAKAPKPEIQLTIYENDSIAYGLLKAFDKMGGYLFEKYNINEQLEANTWEGTLGRLTGTFSNAQQVIDNNPVYKEFRILNETFQKADENGRTAFHEIGEMLTQGANATKNMPNSTAEERAMQREAVVRMASEIANYYGLNAESADCFMTEVYRQVGMDSAIDSGAAIMRSDKYNSVQFVETADTKWSDFLRDNVNDEVKQKIEKVLQKPIDLNSLDKATLEDVLFVIGYNDYGLKQKMFEWEFMNNSLAKETRANFDSAIADEKYASVSQWQGDMRDWLQQFSVSTKEQN